MKKNKENEIQRKALKTIERLRDEGYTLEYIARSLGNISQGYQGPSVFSISRWINKRNVISKVAASRILEIHGKG